MPTPKDFKSIFFRLGRATDLVFEKGPGIIEALAQRDDGLIIAAAYYLDVQINGYRELANALLEAIKQQWPRTDWDKKMAVLEECVHLAEEKPEDWKRAIFEKMDYAFYLYSDQIPDGFVAYFFRDPAFYELLFELRGYLLETFPRAEQGPGIATIAYLDCKLNREEELAQELEKAMHKLWPNLNWNRLPELVSYAEKMESEGAQGWRTKVVDKALDIYTPKVKRAHIIALRGEPPLVA